MASQPTFDGIHIINHYVGDESYQSSDEDGVKDSTLQDTQQRSRIRLHPNLRDTDSEEEDGEELQLSVPQSSNRKSTTVWWPPAGCQSKDMGCQHSLWKTGMFPAAISQRSGTGEGNASSFHMMRITLADLVFLRLPPFL